MSPIVFDGGGGVVGNTVCRWCFCRWSVDSFLFLCVVTVEGKQQVFVSRRLAGGAMVGQYRGSGESARRCGDGRERGGGRRNRGDEGVH